MSDKEDDELVPVRADEPGAKKVIITSPDLIPPKGLKFENYDDLDAVIERMRAAVEETKGGQLTLFYPKSFPARRLINWLNREKYASPTALAERLVDANLICLTKGNPGFSEDSGHYRITDIKAKVRKLTMIKTVVTGNILIKGRHRLNTVYATLSGEKRKLYVLRSQKPYKTHSVHRLKNAFYYLHAPKIDSDAPSLWRALSVTPGGEVMHKPRRARSVTGSSIGYVTLVLSEPRRKRVVLGFESADDKAAWLHALESLGVPHKQERISEEQDYELQDIIETPQYRAALREFMHANHCSEILAFLEAVEGYNTVTDTETRLRLSRTIYDMFVSTTAAQPINIDAKTRQKVEAGIRAGDTSPELFQRAFQYLFYLLESDVYLRFSKSEAYTKMLRDKKGESATHSFIIRGRGERALSFSMVPDEDKQEDLDSLLGELQTGGLLGSNRKGLRTFKYSCTGSALVTWLMQKDLAKLRPAATAIGQRLLNAFLIFHHNGVPEFMDSSKELYMVTTQAPPVEPPPPSAESLLGSLTHEALFTGWVLLKGVKYNRLFVALPYADKKLYIFRNPEAVAPLCTLELKEARFSLLAGDAAGHITSSAGLSNEPRSRSVQNAHQIAKLVARLRSPHFAAEDKAAQLQAQAQAQAQAQPDAKQARIPKSDPALAASKPAPDLATISGSGSDAASGDESEELPPPAPDTDSDDEAEHKDKARSTAKDTDIVTKDKPRSRSPSPSPLPSPALSRVSSSSHSGSRSQSRSGSLTPTSALGAGVSIQKRSRPGDSSDDEDDHPIHDDSSSGDDEDESADPPKPPGARSPRLSSMPQRGGSESKSSRSLVKPAQSRGSSVHNSPSFGPVSGGSRSPSPSAGSGLALGPGALRFAEIGLPLDGSSMPLGPGERRVSDEDAEADRILRASILYVRLTVREAVERTLTFRLDTDSLRVGAGRKFVAALVTAGVALTPWPQDKQGQFLES